MAMRKMEHKQEARKKALEDEAERLDSALELAQQKCRRSGARKRLFAKEFESLKLGLDERRLDHDNTMAGLKNQIDTLSAQLEGRRARTRAEREEALLQMENELRIELETKWKNTLARVKQENSAALMEEEAQAKAAYQAVVDEVGALLHGEYKEKLEELDIEQTKRQQQIAQYVAQIAAMEEAAAGAESQLLEDRESLLERQHMVAQERKEKKEAFAALNAGIRQKWKQQGTSLQDRVQFMLRVSLRKVGWMLGGLIVLAALGG